MLIANNVLPAGSIATPLGYHAVGISPAMRSGDVEVASRTTATSSSPAFVTYRVDPSELTVSPSGLAPTGAFA
jgi:hypothetical protein